MYLYRRKIIYPLVFLLIAGATLFLTVPTIANNVHNPNMIVYMNTDQGGLMDLIWYYYSGEKRPSFQWDFDYGLEMRYLADFARIILSGFMQFTPGSFVLILRWLHLLAWAGALFALGRLVERHFGSSWQAVLACLLLAVRPALAYFCTNLKPEPLVLLIMLIGLDYTLRIVEDPLQRRNLYIACACAALAFLVKFAGVFLLAAIIAAMYFADRRQKERVGREAFPRMKISWILPALAGLILFILPLIFIRFYLRKATGMSWYAEFGLWGSLLENRLALYICIAGICFILLSPLILFLKRQWINRINSYILFSSLIFMGFVLLFGLRWIFDPGHFINIYSQLGSVSTVGAATGMAKKGVISFFLQNLSIRFASFDSIILFLFGCYLAIEIYSRRKGNGSRLVFYKRLVLLVFIVVPAAAMVGMLRMDQHHMLPLFAAICILVIQGPVILKDTAQINRPLRTAVTAIFAVLLMTDICLNAKKLVQARTHQFRQKEDIAFKINRWWQENMPAQAKIAADHYIHVYIPQGDTNVKTLAWNEKDRVSGLRRLVEEFRPQFIYYNSGSCEGKIMPPISEVLPRARLRLIKSFANRPGYQRWPGANYVIYRVRY